MNYSHREVVVYCIRDFNSPFHESTKFEKGKYYNAVLENGSNMYLFVLEKNKKSVGFRFIYEIKNAYNNLFDFVDIEYKDYFEDITITKRRLKLNKVDERNKN